MRIFTFLVFTFFNINTTLAGARYFLSDPEARAQILNLHIEPAIRILPIAEQVAGAVNHMIETQDASKEEVQKGIELLQILTTPPTDRFGADNEEEVVLRTRMRVNKNIEIRFRLVYTLALLLETYKEKYPELISSALSGLSRIAQSDSHSATRRLAMMAFVAFQSHSDASSELLNRIIESDGLRVFDGRYDHYGTQAQMLSSNQEGQPVYRISLYEIDDDPNKLLDRFVYLEGTLSEIRTKGNQNIERSRENLISILESLRDSSHSLSQKYYIEEREYLRSRIEKMEKRLADNQERNSTFWSNYLRDEIASYRDALTNIEELKIPLLRIQKGESLLRDMEVDGHFVQRVNNPSTFTNGVSLEASERNRQFAREILERLEKNQDISLDTLFEIAIKKYRMPNLPQHRHRARG